MKILLVNYRYFISGGPEKYMFNIKNELEKKGHEVIPFSILSNKNIATEYSKYFVKPIGGMDSVYYEDVKKTPKTIIQMISRSLYSLEVKNAIKKEIICEKPDLVYVIHFVNKLSPSVISGAKELNIPVVLRLSDYFLLCPRFDFLYNKQICEECLTKGYYSCIRKKCVKNSLFASLIRVFSMKAHKMIGIYNDVDAFVTPSQFLKTKLIENGFDNKRIHCVPTFANATAKPKNVIGSYGLYFGRITEEKGVDTIVKAYELLNDHHIKIIGDTSTLEAKRLMKYIEERNISNIEFLGFMEGESLENEILNSRFTIIPSIWYDNLPNVALESFQFSKPVLASNIGSLPELVTNDYNGYLFTPGNHLELVEKIKLMDDDERISYMGKNSFELLNNKFNKEYHYNKLMGIFAGLLNEKEDIIN